MDRYLLTTNCADVSPYRERAESFGMGMELQAFAEPEALSGNWRNLVELYKQQLQGFTGDLGFHGAFYDMNSGSRDPEVVELTRKRYQENLIAAGELGAQYIIFHLNYLGPMKLLGYHADWRQRQMDFWANFIDEVNRYGVPVLLENSWEDRPEIIVDLLEEINSPNLKACLDIAHATLYSERPYSEWLAMFKPYLACCHLNNHDGDYDLHLPLGEGRVDYDEVIRAIDSLEDNPFRCLELTSISSIDKSVDFLRSRELA